MTRSLFIAAVLLGSIASTAVHGAELIYSYGFENWTGDRDTTPDYPILKQLHGLLHKP